MSKFFSIRFSLDSEYFDEGFASAVRYQSESFFRFLSRWIVDGGFAPNGYSYIVIRGVARAVGKPFVNSSRVLVVPALFVEDEFTGLDVAGVNEYFMSIVRRVVQEISCDFEFPSDLVLSGVERFRLGGYVNKWIKSKKLDASRKVRAELWFELTISSFRGSLKVFFPDELFDLLILETPPDPVHYEHLVRSVSFLDGCFLVLGAGDRVFFKFDVSSRSGESV